MAQADRHPQPGSGVIRVPTSFMMPAPVAVTRRPEAIRMPPVAPTGQASAGATPISRPKRQEKVCSTRPFLDVGMEASPKSRNVSSSSICTAVGPCGGSAGDSGAQSNGSLNGATAPSNGIEELSLYKVADRSHSPSNGSDERCFVALAPMDVSPCVSSPVPQGLVVPDDPVLSTQRMPSPKKLPTAESLSAVVPPSSSSTHENGVRSPLSSDAAGARFWKPAVGRLVEVYLERRLQDILHILRHLDVLHWRQLLEFYYAVRAWLKQMPSDQSLGPPPVPADVLVYIGNAYLHGGHVKPPMVSELYEPLWYSEAMVLLRLLVGGGSSSGPSETHGLPVPPLVVQFLIHSLSSTAASEFLFTAGLQGYEAAWARHGGDLWLAIQHVILRLYPDESPAGLLEGPRMPLMPDEVPSFLEVIASAALQFSAHLMVGSASSGNEAWSKNAACDESPEASSRQCSADIPPAQAGHCRPRTCHFPVVMRCLGLLNRATVATKRVGDRFLLCLGDVLWQLLGPAPKSPCDLPEPLPSLAMGADCMQSPRAPDIKDLGRIVRTILHAQNTDPAHFAAREAERQRQSMHNGANGSEHSALGVDLLSAGSFAGPSEPGDFVPVLEQGPLRRSLAFMEQSALLHVVQSKLCAAHFPDVVGATEQLSMFALHNMNVLWFDLRRCTSTLKQDPAAGAQDEITTPPSPSGTASALLVLRHLRLGLAPDWEAKLANFPYLFVSGGSKVTVKNLVISIRFSVSHCTGVALQEVDVGLPDLDIQLTCESTVSQICLSVLLEILQNTLKEHIQKQLHKHLLQLLQSEFDKWNCSVWKFITLVVPERLLCRSLKWVGSVIPPEGLPI